MTVNRKCCNPQFDFSKKPRTGSRCRGSAQQERKFERGFKGGAVEDTKTMWRNERKRCREYAARTH